MNKRVVAFFAAVILIVTSVAIFTHDHNPIQTVFTLATSDDSLEVKTVYLTFDDGPSDRVTPKILDVLERENVKATFFIIGRQAEIRSDIIKRIKGEGHTLGVHSYTHEYREIYSSPKALTDDIDRCNDVIESITGERADVYRFPGGSYGLSASLINAVSAHGMRYIDWNASVRDAEIWQPTPYQLYRAAISTSADINNVVLLAHDSTTKTATAEALTDIIRYYKEHGYTFAKF